MRGQKNLVGVETRHFIGPRHLYCTYVRNRAEDWTFQADIALILLYDFSEKMGGVMSNKPEARPGLCAGTSMRWFVIFQKSSNLGEYHSFA